MRWREIVLTSSVALVMATPSVTVAQDKPAVGAPAAKPAVDPAPCRSAMSAADDTRIISDCAALIDSDANASPDRITALLARAAAFTRQSRPDRAIADYTAALARDPFLPDALNARGELWRGKGERPRAIMDFGAALRIDSQHAAAKANQKALAQEIERLGVGAPAKPVVK